MLLHDFIPNLNWTFKALAHTLCIWGLFGLIRLFEKNGEVTEAMSHRKAIIVHIGVHCSLQTVTGRKCDWFVFPSQRSRCPVT